MRGLSVVAGMAKLEPPLTPTANEARALLEAELRSPIYQEPQTPWYMRILERILEFIEKFTGTSMPSSTVLWVVLALAVFLVVVFIIAGPIRRARKVKKPSSVFELNVVTAAEYRLRAQQAAAAGDFSLAAVELFRAVVKRAEEDVLITEDSGRTAHEAARAIANAAPALDSEIIWASNLFDLVEYGGERALATDVARLEDLFGEIGVQPAHLGDLAEASSGSSTQ